MVQILTLDVNLGPAKMAGQIFGMGQRRGTTGIGGHQIHIFLPESGIILASCKFRIEFLKGLVQDFRDIGPAPVTKKTLFIH